MTDDALLALSTLPLLYSRCEVAMQPVRAGGVVREHTGRRATGLPLRAAAFDARARILGVLASWAGLVSAEREVPAPRRTVPELARFLAAHRDWLAGHPGGADFVAELSELVASASEVLQEPGHTVLTGHCPIDGCQAPVRIKPSGAAVRCEAGQETGVPTKEAALAVGVPEATVRQWARRGKLTRYGSARRAEYCLDELTALADTTYDRTPSR